jgi:hypothetical protein
MTYFSSLTCVALLSGSLKPKNYAMRVRLSAPDHSHMPKRKNNLLGPCNRGRFARRREKKERRESRKSFSRKLKSFCGDSAPEMTVKDLENKGSQKGKKSVSLTQRKGKLLSEENVKIFRTSAVTCPLAQSAPASNSLSQLALPSPSPLAHELLDAVVALPIAA